MTQFNVTQTQGTDFQVSSTRRGSLLDVFLGKDPSLTKSVLEQTPSVIINATGEFIFRQEERRRQQTIGEQAVTELVEQPARILKGLTVDFPRLIVGGLSEAGKTLEEFIATPFIGSEKAQELARGTEEQRALETKLFGFEPTTFADYTEAIQKFVNESPVATPSEKKLLPIVLPMVLFGIELTPFGRSSSGLKPILTRIAKSKNADEIATLLGPVIKGDDAAKKELAEQLVGVTKAVEVDRILRSPIKTPFAEGIPEEFRVLAEEARKFKTLDEFIESNRKIQPSRTINELIENYADGEREIRRLEVLMERELARSERLRLEAIVADFERGNRSVVKQLSREIGADEFTVIEGLTDFIDIGARKGKRSVTDFYKFIERPKALLTDVFNKVKKDPTLGEKGAELRRERLVKELEDARQATDPERLQRQPTQETAALTPEERIVPEGKILDTSSQHTIPQEETLAKTAHQQLTNNNQLKQHSLFP